MQITGSVPAFLATIKTLEQLKLEVNKVGKAWVLLWRSTHSVRSHIRRVLQLVGTIPPELGSLPGVPAAACCVAHT